MKVHGLLLLPNGTRHDVSCDVDSWDDLKEDHGVTFFDIVRGNQTTNQATILVDDEGLLKDNNPLNFWSVVVCPLFEIGQPLTGPIWIFGPANDQGEMTDIDPDLLAKIPPILRPKAGFEVHFLDSGEDT